jgi:hypothetical protein
MSIPSTAQLDNWLNGQVGKLTVRQLVNSADMQAIILLATNEMGSCSRINPTHAHAPGPPLIRSGASEVLP